MTPPSRRVAGLPISRRALVGLTIGVAGLALLAVAIFVLPGLLAPRDDFDNAGDAVRAQNDARGLLLQAAGGLVLVVGAYVTWRQLQISREGLQHNLRAATAQLQATHDQLTIAQDGQITQRFTQAIDQLGSEQIVVRLGGIYGLERIARNSFTDAATIAEILSSYIRQHSPRLADDDMPTGSPVIPAHLQTRAADVQAALTILARGAMRPEGEERLRLPETDLRRANLTKARLAGADFEGANLGWAWLRLAQLPGADLTDANLQTADLGGANLEGAELVGANLQGAHLQGASLLGADLDGARLHQAVADQETRWPAGFDPQQAGVVVMPPGEQAQRTSSLR
ncbi:pentapeptide repeat-containing protein [Streptomyces chartreusis]|uniref:pentapeptide repeat-containing protein n=1 Tax=Streptomyces chartreusis TaxID=1969 RepID=UPI003D8A5F74